MVRPSSIYYIVAFLLRTHPLIFRPESPDGPRHLHKIFQLTLTERSNSRHCYLKLFNNNCCGNIAVFPEKDFMILSEEALYKWASIVSL